MFCNTFWIAGSRRGDPECCSPSRCTGRHRRGAAPPARDADIQYSAPGIDVLVFRSSQSHPLDFTQSTSTRPRRRISSASCYCPRRTTARRWLPTGRSGCVFTGRSTRTDCSSLRDRRRTDIGSRNCRWLSCKPRNPSPIGNCRSGQPGNHAWRHVAATPDARNGRRI